MWAQIEQLIQLSQKPIPGLYLEELPGNPERRNYYRFLYHLIKWRQPYLALEIGIEGGFASAYLCAGTKGQVAGIDLHRPGMELPSNYHFIEGDSTSTKTWTALSYLVDAYGKIGLVYQDSSHHYNASKIEWAFYTQFMASESIWICDDITPAFHDPLIDPPGLGMVQYFEELPGEKRLYPNVLHRGNTQGIVLL